MDVDNAFDRLLDRMDRGEHWAAATVIGFVVLGQVPTWQDLAGVTLVIIGVAIHHEPSETPPAQDATDAPSAAPAAAA